MKKNQKPFICLFSATSAPVETEEDNKKSQELKAIEKVSANLEAYKTQLGEKVDKEQMETLEQTIKELKEGLEEMTGKQVTEKMNTINEGMKNAFDQIGELQEKLREQNDGGVTEKKNGSLFSKKELKGFIDEVFDEDGKKTSNKPSLTIKAAETFGYGATFVSGAQVDAFTGRTVDPELYEQRRKSNLILDYFPMRPIDTPKLIYLVKVEEGTGTAPDNLPGGADWIDSGEAKPKRSFRLDTEEVEAKKVAIFSTIEDKLLRDVASFDNWIREDLMDEMREAINDGLLNNDPGTNAKAPLGLKTDAVQYTATPAYDELIENPNYIDDIIAVLAFMRYNKETPSIVFISSDVYYRIHHLKATDGKWLNNNLVYVNNAGQLFIAGVLVVPADEEDVPSTNILAVDLSAFKIRPYGPMVLERGLNGEDFREDKTSFRGYQEFLTYLPTHRENGVVYDTFANIETAITLPQA